MHAAPLAFYLGGAKSGALKGNYVLQIPAVTSSMRLREQAHGRQSGFFHARPVPMSALPLLVPGKAQGLLAASQTVDVASPAAALLPMLLLLLPLLLLSVVRPSWHPVLGWPVQKPLLMSTTTAAWQRGSSGQPQPCRLLVHPAPGIQKVLPACLLQRATSGQAHLSRRLMLLTYSAKQAQGWRGSGRLTMQASVARLLLPWRSTRQVAAWSTSGKLSSG